ncbi:uncharacterized protein TRIADDRAFT_52451 [Trichoplax adhaerens]|uniref:Uncharacterized protein n=1 Tax=Trichoplax adhaerens TaxID=10228 RepID=B3RIL8_TRIAD|nr:hypothetical protein TRIADDRAFT_52451 [Trichoplax adhaerens]EDV29741.1 hypothetical protein TRIADDRAFT_52451 [Trichoplax adhaerens]|eukprot:XP_002108943.1 hypothetical protein TRIADDRAFT_52451 [Trichoplax adhaerens]
MAVHATKIAIKKAKLQNAAFYGDVSNHNPVLLAFEQELECFLKFFRPTTYDDSITKQANNIQSRRYSALFKIWNNYENRLPRNLFYERLLDVGDFLLKEKQYQMAFSLCYSRYLKLHHNAELFAKRGISKINDLIQLEQMSALGVSISNDQIFKEALMKMNLMIFRRICIDSRRKSKGQLRPRLKQNLSDIKNQAWPRTLTERLINDTFIGSSAHFLAVLEGLQYHSHRRTLHIGSVSFDADEFEVYNELFYAGLELLYHSRDRVAININVIDHKDDSRRVSQIDLAIKGGNGVTLIAATRFVKAAFSFEHWDTFNTLCDPILSFLKDRKDYHSLADYKILQLMISYRNIIFSQTHTAKAENSANQEEGTMPFEALNDQDAKQDRSISGIPPNKHSCLLDDLLRFADVIESCLEIPYQEALKIHDSEVIADAALMLRSHCKSHFNRVVSPTYDNCRHIINDDNSIKWIRLLEVSNRIMNVSNATLIDPIGAGETALRLALLLECVAEMPSAGMVVGYQTVITSGKNSDRSTTGYQTSSSAALGNIRVNSNTAPTVTLREANKSSKISYNGDIRTDRENLGSSSALSNRHNDSFIRGSQNKYENSVQFEGSMIRNPIKPTLVVEDADIENEANRESVTELSNLLDDVSSYPLSFDPTSAYYCLIKAGNVLENVLQEIDKSADTYIAAASRMSDNGNEAKRQHNEKESHVINGNKNKNTLHSSKDNAPPLDKTATQYDTILSLQAEISFVLLRILLKLSRIQIDVTRKTKAKIRRPCNTTPVKEEINMPSYSEEDIKKKYGSNTFTKALFLMQLVGLNHETGATLSEYERQTLEHSYELLSQLQKNEANTVISSKYQEKTVEGTVPPTPQLLHRSGQTMIFKPAPFVPSDGSKIAYYCLFGRNASGSNVKARLGDYQLSGTGILIPADKNSCEIQVTDLTPNDRYTFAFAAYTIDGTLIGNNVGISTRPIVASSPAQVMMGYALLCQVAYQVGAYAIAKSCATILWENFVEDIPTKPSQFYIERISEEVVVRLRRLKKLKVINCSHILLRQFFQTIFIDSDCHIREKSLYCNTLCDDGPLYPGQIARTRECEHMVIAFEIAGWLNDSILMIQVLVQCYGLLAPFIQLQVPSFAVIRILLRCHCVMHELPPATFRRRNPTTTDSLHRMVASIDYFVALCLRVTRQKKLADSINEATKKLLSIDSTPETQPTDNDHEETINLNESANVATASQIIDNKSIASLSKVVDGRTLYPAGGSLSHNTLYKSKKKKKKQRSGKEKESDPYPNEKPNDELKALEALMVHMNSSKMHGREELTGAEDESVLYAYIQNLPAPLAYREVTKFRRRARFLEFFVHIVVKASQEGHAELILEWSTETFHWLQRRNEMILVKNTNVLRQNAGGGNEDSKRYGAAVIEYSHHQQQDSTISQKYLRSNFVDDKPDSARQQNDYYGRTAVRPSHLRRHERSTSRTKERRERNDDEMAAIQILKNILPDFWRAACRRRRLRQVSSEEMAWRSQLNIQLGLCNFTILINRLEAWRKLTDFDFALLNNIIDYDWLGLLNIGKVLIEWDGNPLRWFIDENDHEVNSDDNTDKSDKHDDRPATVAATREPEIINNLQPSPEKNLNGRSEVTNSAPIAKKYQRGQRIVDEAENEMYTQQSLDLVKKIFTCFSRAITLAHRGRHWILLQNAARSMWNCINSIYQHCLAYYCVYGNEFSPELPNGSTPLHFDSVRNILWRHCYRLADNILDMIEQIQGEEKELSSRRMMRLDIVDTDHLTGYFGELKNETGGSGLFFESPLDDGTKLDLRWVSKVILTSIQHIYLEGRWEHLADLCIRFNNITGNKYANIIVPLQVVAQRRIAARILANHGQLPDSYRTTIKTMYNSSKNVNSNTVNQSTPPTRSSDMTFDRINVYENSNDALKVTNISLDVGRSLGVLRQYLNSASYTARCVQHCRQLLLRYVAGRIRSRNGHNTPYSDGSENTFHDQEQVIDSPKDIYNEKFKSMPSLHCVPLKETQFNVVLSAYQKTIELLQHQKDNGLIAQMMQELGNLMFHAGDIKMALKWWSGSLDALLKKPDALANWRGIFRDKAESRHHYIALDRCGIWGCLKVGIIAADIAQFIHSTDLGIRLDCCLLAATLFKGLFATSLPHPSADTDYAFYEIGDHISPELLSGIDLFSDYFRCDGSSLLGALRYVAYELTRSNYQLRAFPVLILYQYLATYICRDAKAAVEARILRIIALTDLGYYTEALLVLGQTLNGEKVPKIEDSHFRQPESTATLLRFVSARPLTDEKNYKIISQLLEKPISSGLSTLYGTYLTNKLRLAQAHLAVGIAKSITVIPAQHSSGDSDFYISGRESKTKHRRQSSLFKSSAVAFTRNIQSVLFRKQDEILHKVPLNKARSNSLAVKTSKTNTDTKHGPIPKLEIIRHNIVRNAEKLLVQIYEEVMESAKQALKSELNVNNIEISLVLKNLSALELDALTQVYLLFADIALLRNQSLVSAQLTFDCLKLIQESVILSDEDYGGSQVYSSLSSGMYAKSNRARKSFEDYFRMSHLDMRLWLKCRLCLVVALNESFGTYNKNSVDQLFGDCKYHIEEGITEAQAFNEHEAAIQFATQGIIFDLKQGKDSKLIQQELEDVIKVAQNLQDTSINTQLFYTLALAQQTDLSGMQKNYYTLNNLKARFKEYQVVHEILLNQLMNLGIPIHRHKTESHFSSPFSPLPNIYLPQLLHLAQIKLRIGHIMAQIVAVEAMEKDIKPSYNAWLPVASILTTALEILRVCTHRTPNVEAEILLSLGQVQRQLYNLHKMDGQIVASTFVDAIKVSYMANHDHTLIRQAYLEMALVYLKRTDDELGEEFENSDNAELAQSNVAGTLTDKGQPLTSIYADTDRISAQSQSTHQKDTRYGIRTKGRGKLTRDQIRAANLLHQLPTKAQSESTDVRIKQQKKENDIKLKEEQEKQTQRSAEVYAAWSSIRAASLSASARHYLSSLSSNISSLSSSRIPVDAYATIPDFALLDLLGDKILNRDLVCDNESNYLNWSQILTYYTCLQRECFNASTVTVVESQPIPADSDLGVQEELGINIHDSHLSYIGEQSRIRVAVIRTPIFLNKSAAKVASMHTFLLNTLMLYKDNCCSVYPPMMLDLSPTSPSNNSITTAITYKIPGSMSLNKENKSVIANGQLLQGLSITSSTSLSATVKQEASDSKFTISGSNLVTRESNASVASDNEICFQWYRPPIQRINYQLNGNLENKSNVLDKPCIILLYAINMKSIPASDPVQGAKNVHCGQIVIPYSDVVVIHNGLIELKHAVEAIISSKLPKSPDQQSSPGRRRRSLKQLAGIVTNQESIKAQLKQCQLEIIRLLTYYSNESDMLLSDIDISCISGLESLFNPNRGHIYTGGELFTWLSALLKSPISE